MNDNKQMNLDNNTDKLNEILTTLHSITKQHPHYDGGQKTVNGFIEEWLEDKHGVDISEKTYENYEGRYRNHIQPFFIDMKLIDADHKVISSFVKYLITRGITAGMIHDIVCVLSIALNEAANVLELIPKNPCKGVHLPKVRKKSTRPSITDNEIKILYRVCTNKDNAGYHYWIAIPLLTQTGMRKGELLALTWDDIRHDSINDVWSIRINKSVSYVRGKGLLQDFTKTPEGCRDIVINNDMAELLMLYKEKTQKNERTYVIAQKKQDKWEDPRNFHRTLKNWIEKAGVRKELSAHAFRHAFATRLFLEHANMDAIKRQGGWKDDKMPYYYANEMQTEVLKNECADIMGRHFEGVFNAVIV